MIFIGDILKIERLCCKYQAENGEVEAVREVNLTVAEGEIVGIIGPSGCGKSTVLSIIAGLEKATGGSVVAGGSRVDGVRGDIGYMMQSDNLLEWRTIRKNVLLGLEIQKICTPENIEYADRLINEYGLGDDLVAGANIAGFIKVAEAMKAQGCV